MGTDKNIVVSEFAALHCCHWVKGRLSVQGLDPEGRGEVKGTHWSCLHTQGQSPFRPSCPRVSAVEQGTGSHSAAARPQEGSRRLFDPDNCVNVSFGFSHEGTKTCLSFVEICMNSRRCSCLYSCPYMHSLCLPAHARRETPQAFLRARVSVIEQETG